MNTYPTGVPETTPRAKSKGDRPVNAIERSTIRAIEEAVTVGCGLNLRHAMTAEAAYYLAERRGFKPGHEFEDWLAAEAEIQSLWTRAFEEAPLHCGN
jgi:Protein of unknown function (DUF2934)